MSGQTENRVKLNLRACREAAEGFAWDTMLPGFGLRVLASGRRSFVIRYRNASGTDRLLTLGTLAELHPDEAREMAREAFAAVRRGDDPRAERKARRAAATMRELRDRFLADHASQKKPGTARNYEILWRLHVLPAIGEGTAVCDVTEADVIRLRRRMESTPYNANRALEVCRKAFDLAERWGMRPRGTNPAEYVEDFPEAPRERILTEEEVARLWSALDDEAPIFAALVRLLLLTGRRLDEWRTATWSAVDLDRATLTLRDSKAGPMTHPIPPEAIEILRTLPRVSVFVFPGRTGGPLGGQQKWWRRLRKRAGLDGVRLHDLRHTAGSYAHAAGLTQREIADLLGHKQISTAARYIHGIGTGKHDKSSVAAAKIFRIARK